MTLPLSVRRESSTHSLIEDANKVWIATINTAVADAEAVRKLIEEQIAAKAAG
mgnify:CR=1 FL=1